MTSALDRRRLMLLIILAFAVIIGIFLLTTQDAGATHASLWCYTYHRADYWSCNYFWTHGGYYGPYLPPELYS